MNYNKNIEAMEGKIMYSKLVLVGNIAKINKQDRLSILTVAVSRNTSQEVMTDFFDIKCFEKLTEKLEDYNIGDLVVVDGSIQQSKFQTKEGKNRTEIQIVAMSIKRLKKATKKEEEPREKINPKEYDTKIDEYDDLPF